MKVLHVIPSLSAVHGGPSRAIRLIAQALTAHGVAVEIATTDDDGPGKRFSPSQPPPQVGEEKSVGSLPACGKSWGGEACGLEPRAEASTNRAPFPASPTRGGGVPGQSPIGIGSVRRYFPKRTEFYKVSPGFARWVFSHVRDYDVVHIHALFSFTSIAAAWAARRAGVPYVVRPLGTLAQYGVTQRRPWLKRLSLKFIEGPILRHAAAVHFTAKAEKAEAEALGIAMRGVVIPLGVEVAAVSPSPPALSREGRGEFDWGEGTAPTKLSPPPLAGEGWGEGGNPLLAQYPQLANIPIVLYLSRLDAKKNVEGLLRAFNLLRHNIAPSPLRGAGWGESERLILLIAGDGEPAYVAGLKKLADALGLTDRVIWAGYLDGEIKAGALAAARVFALPSYSENFGIAAAEALLAGLPCVLGKGVAIADDVVQAGAGLAVLPEPEEIATALRTILDDEGLHSSMGQRAAVLARERYSLEAMGERLAELYKEIVSSKR